jgi:hypothetical protein
MLNLHDTVICITWVHWARWSSLHADKLSLWPGQVFLTRFVHGILLIKHISHVEGRLLLAKTIEVFLSSSLWDTILQLAVSRQITIHELFYINNNHMQRTLLKQIAVKRTNCLNWLSQNSYLASILLFSLCWCYVLRWIWCFWCYCYIFQACPVWIHTQEKHHKHPIHLST